MSNTIIERRICVDPQYLNKNIKHAIFEKIKESSKNECTKENGYILDVIKIIKIKDNYISNVNSEIVFIVEFEVITLKPDIGKKLSGNVCMVFSGGLFINIKDKIKVLVPINSLKNYNFGPAKKNFFNKTNTIKEGDLISIVITGIKYSKKNFSCFGDII